VLTQELLKEFVNYNQETGIFRHIKARKGVKLYSIAGTLCRTGYINISVNGKIYQSHRLAWLYVYGEWPEKHLDHINGNPSDNRIANLRLADISENARNKKLFKNNTSGVKGVTWDKYKFKWKAYVGFNRKLISLGYFDSIEEAKQIVQVERLRLHGNFANNG